MIGLRVSRLPKMESQYPDPSYEGYQANQGYNPFSSSRDQPEPALPSLGLFNNGIDISNLYRYNQQPDEETPQSDCKYPSFVLISSTNTGVVHAVPLEDSNDNDDTTVFGGLPNMQSLNASSHGDQSQFSTTHQGFLTQEVENAGNNMPPPVPHQQYGGGHQQHQYASYSNQKPSQGTGRETRSRPPLQQRNLNSGQPEANTPFPQQLGQNHNAQTGFTIHAGQQGFYQHGQPPMLHGNPQGFVAQPMMHQANQPPAVHPAITFVPRQVANTQVTQTQQRVVAPSAPKKEKPHNLQVFKTLSHDDVRTADYDSLALTDREVVLSWMVTYRYTVGELAFILQYFEQISQVLGRHEVVRILRQRVLVDTNEAGPNGTYDPLDPLVKFNTTNGVPPSGYMLTNDVTPQYWPVGNNSQVRFTTGNQFHSIPGYTQSWEPIPVGKTCADVMREYPNHCVHEGIDPFLQHSVGADAFIRTLQKARGDPNNPSNTVLTDMIACGRLPPSEHNNTFLKRLDKRLEVMIKKYGPDNCELFYQKDTAIMLREPGDMIVQKITKCTDIDAAVDRMLQVQGYNKPLQDATDQRSWPYEGSGSVFDECQPDLLFSHAFNACVGGWKRMSMTAPIGIPRFRLTTNAEYKQNPQRTINTGRLPQAVASAVQIGAAPGQTNAQASQQGASIIGQNHQAPAVGTQAPQLVTTAANHPQQTSVTSLQTVQQNGTSSTLIPVDPQLLNQSSGSGSNSGDGDDNSNGSPETDPSLETEGHQLIPDISCSIKDGKLGSFGGIPVWDSESEYMSQVIPLLKLLKQVHSYGDLLADNTRDKDMTKSRYLRSVLTGMLSTTDSEPVNNAVVQEKTPDVSSILLHIEEVMLAAFSERKTHDPNIEVCPTLVQTCKHAALENLLRFYRVFAQCTALIVNDSVSQAQENCEDLNIMNAWLRSTNNLVHATHPALERQLKQTAGTFDRIFFDDPYTNAIADRLVESALLEPSSMDMGDAQVIEGSLKAAKERQKSLMTDIHTDVSANAFRLIYFTQVRLNDIITEWQKVLRELQSQSSSQAQQPQDGSDGSSGAGNDVDQDDGIGGEQPGNDQSAANEQEPIVIGTESKQESSVTAQVTETPAVTQITVQKEVTNSSNEEADSVGPVQSPTQAPARTAKRARKDFEEDMVPDQSQSASDDRVHKKMKSRGRHSELGQSAVSTLGNNAPKQSRIGESDPPKKHSNSHSTAEPQEQVAANLKRGRDQPSLHTVEPAAGKKRSAENDNMDGADDDRPSQRHRSNDFAPSQSRLIGDSVSSMPHPQDDGPQEDRHFMSNPFQGSRGGSGSLFNRSAPTQTLPNVPVLIDTANHVSDERSLDLLGQIKTRLGDKAEVYETTMSNRLKGLLTNNELIKCCDFLLENDQIWELHIRLLGRLISSSSTVEDIRSGLTRKEWLARLQKKRRGEADLLKPLR